MAFSVIETFVDGPVDRKDILRSLGIEALARYIAGEPHDVYPLRCLKTNDKPIKLIVCQMLRRVQIVEAGDANYIVCRQLRRRQQRAPYWI